MRYQIYHYLPLLPDKPNSNPEIELIGTFETQLSTMRKDLASKQQMLSMYETSMADLSSKVHHLKKTLDEKVRRLLTRLMRRLLTRLLRRLLTRLLRRLLTRENLLIAFK